MKIQEQEEFIWSGELLATRWIKSRPQKDYPFDARLADGGFNSLDQISFRGGGEAVSWAVQFEHANR